MELNWIPMSIAAGGDKGKMSVLTISANFQIWVFFAKNEVRLSQQYQEKLLAVTLVTVTQYRAIWLQ